MAKVTQEFNIKQVFSETKEALNKGITKNEGRIDMLNELEQFFDTNHLKVVQEVEVPDTHTEPEKKAK